MDILNILSFSGLSRPKSGNQNRFYNLTSQLRNNNNMIILEQETNFDPSDNEVGKVYTYHDPTILNHEFNILRDFSLSFILNIRRILNENELDLIQIAHPSGLLAVKIILFFRREKIKIVYDALNVESDFIYDVIDDIELPKLFKCVLPLYIRFIEYLAVKLADHITCVSEKDEKIFIDRYNIQNKITVIPSGCSIPDNTGLKKEDIRKKWNIDPHASIILFHGSFSHPPNREAFGLITNQIAPHFQKKPQIIFLLAGTGLEKFQKFNVRSLGFVEELNEVIKMADVAIVPLKKGGGTKLKILDYLGAGLPTITTPKGIEGINATNNENIIVIEDLDGMIKSINTLVTDKNKRNKIGTNARKLAVEHYDWVKIGSDLNKFYLKLLKENHFD
ncbi:glycosyltransferase [uncultured Methanobacterium sp.]|uniref:glycosyltransferase n=1 Tax=uncultured Methanobacterium sp. TaxID=176306 RepID=UPI002AA5FF5E|nr:glycosyltransferase [uncultured Methanobacterium sp.]